jgi:asparagine synthase (glutamine-hydrolysing)
LSELARRGKFWTLMREAAELSRKSPNPSFTSRRIAWEYGIRTLIPGGVERLARRLLGRQPKAKSEIDGVINLSFADRMNVAERAGETSDDGSRRKKTAREAHCESLDSGLIPYALELADRASAAFGVEARYPFFDRRLMEFCVALPADQKLKRGWTRSVMRRAMTGILPAEVQWRIGKANLSPNFKRRLLDFGRPTIEEIIENAPEFIESYVNLPALRAAYGRYSSQPTRGGQDALTVYGAVMLGCWLRKSDFASTSDQSQKQRLAGRLASANQASSEGGLRETSRRLRASGGV